MSETTSTASLKLPHSSVATIPGSKAQKRRSTSTIPVSETTHRLLERRALREELNKKMAEILAKPFSRLPVASDLPRLRRGFRISKGNGAVLYDEVLDTRTNGDDEKLGTLRVLKSLISAISKNPQQETADLERIYLEATNGDIKQGQLSEILKPILSSKCPGIGETSLVAMTLKCVCQDAIFPAIAFLHGTIFTKGFPFKDSRGSWRVHVCVYSQEEVVVTHYKKQQASDPPIFPTVSQNHKQQLERKTTPVSIQEQPSFEFEWILEIHLRGSNNPQFWAQAHIQTYNLNEKLLTPVKKEQLVSVLSNILHPSQPFIEAWHRQEARFRAWEFLRSREFCIIGPDKEILMDLPSPGILFRETIYYLFLALATGLDSVSGEGNFVSRVNEACPEQIYKGHSVFYWQFPGIPHLSLLFRLFSPDFIEPATTRLKQALQIKRYPFKLKQNTTRKTQLTFLHDGRIEFLHTQTESSLIPGRFEFTWQLSAAIAPGFASLLDISLKIIDLAFFDSMPESDRDDFILSVSELIDRSTLNRCLVMMPLDQAVVSVLHAVETLITPLQAQNKELLGNLNVPAVDLLKGIAEALAHMQPLPSIPVKRGDVSELLAQSASPKLLFRRAESTDATSTSSASSPLSQPPFTPRTIIQQMSNDDENDESKMLRE